MSLYTHIVIESAWAATVFQSLFSVMMYVRPTLHILPGLVTSDATFFAMKAFGGFNMPLACLLAAIGATLGQVVNWIIGKTLLLLNRKATPIDDYWFSRAVAWFHQYGVFLLLLSWIPLCNLFVVMAGMANARLRLVLPLVFAGQLAGYGYYALT